MDITWQVEDEDEKTIEKFKPLIHGFKDKENISDKVRQAANELRKVLAKYNVLIADVDLETDLYQSPLQDSLQKYYGSEKEEEVVAQMKDKKAINMYDYLKKKKSDLKQLRGDSIAEPLMIAKRFIEHRYGAY